MFTWALIFLRKIMKKVMKVAQICFEIDVNFIDFGAFFVNLSLRKVEIVYWSTSAALRKKVPTYNPKITVVVIDCCQVYA